jgi:hypothetical protein
VQRYRQVLERFVLEVAGDQLAQAGGGDEMVTRAEEAEQPCERVQREHLPAFQVAPDGGERVGSGDGLGPGRDERAVHRAGGRPDDQVRRDATLGQGPQHAGLNRAEAGAPRENERDLGSVGAGHMKCASSAAAVLPANPIGKRPRERER